MTQALHCLLYKANLTNESVCGKVLCAFKELPDCLHTIFPGAENNQAIILAAENPRMQIYVVVITDYKKISSKELEELEGKEVLVEQGRVIIQN